MIYLCSQSAASAAAAAGDASAATAAAAVAALCVAILLPLLLLFVIVHLPNEAILHTHSRSSTHCHFFLHERKYSTTPLGSTFAFVRPRLLPILSLSRPLRVFVEPQAGASLPRRSPPCVYMHIILYQVRADKQCGERQQVPLIIFVLRPPTVLLLLGTCNCLGPAATALELLPLHGAFNVPAVVRSCEHRSSVWVCGTAAEFGVDGAHSLLLLLGT